MNRFWKLVFATLVGLSLLTVLAVGAVVWAAVQGAFDPSSVLVINDEVVEFGPMGLWDAGGAVIGLAIAAVVVMVVVPGSLLIALGATLFGLAVAAVCLFGVAAMLLLPVLLPVGLLALGVWLWSRRQRQQERNRQRALA